MVREVIKRSILLLTATAVLITTPIPIFADDYLDSAQLRQLLSVQQSLYNDKFREADSLTEAMIEQYPDDPAGYLFRAVTLITMMFDREDNLYPEEFNRLIDSVHSKASSLCDTASNGTHAWMCLFLGHAEAYRSLWESRFGSLVTAIKKGHRAKKEYEQGLTYDSSLYDLYFGLGLYYYWKSAKAGILRWIGLICNDRDKGIAQLYLAADSSLISRESARSAMIWIRLDRKEYDSVIAGCRQMRKKYPEGKALLWPLARAYYEKKDYRNSLQTFQLLHDQIADDPGNYFNLIECDYHLYRCFEKLSMKAEAAKVADRMQQYYEKIPKYVLRKQRSKIALLRRAAKI
jgi:tetratricopeptide (TPR) repeat protein